MTGHWLFTAGLGEGVVLGLAAAVALQSLNLAFSGPGFLQFAGALVSGAGLITGAALMHRATQDRRRGPTAPTTTDPAS